MYRIIPTTFLLAPMMISAQAADIENCQELTTGRCMRVLNVPEPNASVLVGKAPAAEGSFRILDGSVVLWEGRNAETFQVKPYSKKVYLVNESVKNVRWQELTWKEQFTPLPKPGKHHTWGKGSDWSSHLELQPNTDNDSGPAMRELLQAAARQSLSGSSVTLELPKGEYHFYPEGALRMSYYISNHDQQDIQPVGVPIVGQKNLTINGNGSTFIFHGRMQPILLMDSQNITLRDITIRHDNPYYNEGKIVEIKDGTTTLEFTPSFRWEVKNKRYYLMGDGEAKSPGAVLAFQQDGRMVPTGRGGDIAWPNHCQQVAPNRVKFFTDAAAKGLQVGHILVLRHYGRPHPAMVLYRADGTVLNNVVFQDSQGMALIAQRSRDITIDGGGCICAPDRVYTVSADATHFSNCAGTITVKNALYEGMMDDAINVHSTCLAIEKLVSDREFIARYMHPQAVGFEVFLPGEKVQFIKGRTLENHPECATARKVEKIDETHLRIVLDAPLPAGICAGDAIENADWYPAVNFIGCTVRHNRARGSLFTTPKPVLVKDCKFVASHGSAILLAGDAQGWYESGRCLDVRIINNLFDHNLTARYQFTEAIISIYPEVKEPNRQTERYHRNILIEGNTFLTHKVPLLYAISTDNLIFRNNVVKYDDQYPGMHGGTPYILKHCGKINLQKL
ncbi:MAG: hypothetical protein IJN29_06510 [Akkermansia sp.]|nr:hypothetical protein [Akkermansia sp.]